MKEARLKKIIVLLAFLITAQFSYAAHITGGEMYYTYLGPTNGNPGKISYKITLVLYKDTTSVGPNVANLGYTSYFSIFRGDNYQHVADKTATLTKYEYMNLTTYDPCLTNTPRVSYAVATYEATFDVDTLSAGYYAANSQCCRVSGVINMNSNSVGSTYWVKIPGSLENIYAPNNSSAIFNKKDTILVCRNSPLNIDFSATDPDGDELRYSFTSGYIGAASGPTQAQITPVTANTPTYTGVTYTTSYNSTQPLGPDVVINQQTGKVTGIAPNTTGIYLMTVLVEEYRNGNKISEHRKEFQVRVDDCSLTGAVLKPTYITCNGTTLNFQNESTSSNITSYLWDFGVPSLTTDTSTSPTPSYDYLKSGKDSGTYTVKLKVASSGGCQDSTTSLVKVYPGFVPKFTVTGSCVYNDFLFNDATTSTYGSVKSWKWDFGDLTSQADTATSKDSAWKYPAPATVKVKLTVSNTYGCIDTSTQSLTILDKPTLSLPFRDTLICSNDTLALKVNANSGTILWQAANGPNQSRILNTSSNSPLVYPQDTTRYYVTVKDNGCTNTDSVNVNVLQFISVKAGVDTGICLTDTFRLNPTSYALSYQWTASSGVTVQNIKRPLIQPLVNTRYYVTANLGKCQANDSVLVKVVPYPQANAGADAVICYGSRVQLTGNIVGTNFTWSPTASLIKENTLAPVAGPTKTTAYILRVTDTIGCPKPKSDTVLITVIPQIIADAGKDTSVLINQPLQMNASGGITYAWTPTTGLSNPAIANPIAIFDDKTTDITYTVRVSEGSCYTEDKVTVHVFKTGPDILVPSAFTPNGDGKNDVSKPVLLGVIKLSYFNIYNRWGQLLFATNQENKGWDGNYNGVAQPPGTYVYQALGTDYLGNPVIRKGTIVLIR